MRLPIRNASNGTLTIVLEPSCEQFEVPRGGEAIIWLEDGRPHSIEFNDPWFVTVFNEGANLEVVIASRRDMRIDDELRLIRAALYALGAENEASLIDKTIEELEIALGYFGARSQVFSAFYDGFSAGDATPHIGDMSGDRWKADNLAACYRAGITVARLNCAARDSAPLPDRDEAPLDTRYVRSAFTRALIAIGELSTAEPR